MAGWGALMGLGQGLQDSAQMWNEHQKSKLAENLAKEREQRQADRDLAKEKRQAAAELARVDKDASSVDLDPATGTFKRTLRNSRYDVLDTVAVGEMEAESIRRQREQAQAELRTKSLDAQLREINLGRLPQKWAQEDAMHRARLGSESALQTQRYASARASDRRGLAASMESSAPVSREQYANELVKEYKAAFDRAEVPINQRDGLATAAVQRAAIDGTSPAQAMLELIREYREGAPRAGQKSPGSGSAGTPRKGTLLGN